ncbi:MAG: lipopolysaccharide biosynthesis protein [Betaproteobacteria bacterium]
MPIEHQAAAALKWNSAAKLLSQTFSWIVTLVVVRLLAPGDYGLMAITTVVISIIAGTAEFGLGSALIQAQSLNKHELARIAGALGLLNVTCGVALAIAAPWIAGLFAEPGLEWVIRVSTLTFFLSAIDVVPQSLMTRDMNFRGNAGIELATVVTASATTLLLAWLEGGVWALVIGNLAGATVRTVLLLVFGTLVMPSFRLTGIGKHIRFGGQVTAARFLWQLTYQMDTLIAARVLHREVLGIYSVSMHLATLPMNKVIGIVNQVAFSAIARLQDERPRLRASLLGALRLMAFVAIPTIWGLSAVAAEFVAVVLGDKWRDAVIPLQLVSIVAPARMLMAILATATDGIGRTGLGLRNAIISASILPVAFVIGVQWGLVGLATSWLIAIPLILAISLPGTCAALGLPLRDLFTATKAPLLGGLAMYAAVGAARLGLDQWPEPARLPALIAIGAIAYLIVVRSLDRAIWTDARRLVSALRG